MRSVGAEYPRCPASELPISQHIDFRYAIAQKPTRLITHRQFTPWANAAQVPKDTVGIALPITVADENRVSEFRDRQHASMEPTHYRDIRRNLHGHRIGHAYRLNAGGYVKGWNIQVHRLWAVGVRDSIRQ